MGILKSLKDTAIYLIAGKKEKEKQDRLNSIKSERDTAMKKAIDDFASEVQEQLSYRKEVKMKEGNEKLDIPIHSSDMRKTGGLNTVGVASSFRKKLWKPDSRKKIFLYGAGDTELDWIYQNVKSKTELLISSHRKERYSKALSGNGKNPFINVKKSDEGRLLTIPIENSVILKGVLDYFREQLGMPITEKKEKIAEGGEKD